MVAYFSEEARAQEFDDAAADDGAAAADVEGGGASGPGGDLRAGDAARQVAAAYAAHRTGSGHQLQRTLPRSVLALGLGQSASVFVESVALKWKTAKHLRAQVNCWAVSFYEIVVNFRHVQSG